MRKVLVKFNVFSGWLQTTKIAVRFWVFVLSSVFSASSLLCYSCCKCLYCSFILLNWVIVVAATHFTYLVSLSVP